MKKLILILVLGTLSLSQSNAQIIKGELLINGKSSESFTMKNNYVIQLFDEFKNGNNNITFEFKGSNYNTSIRNKKPEFTFFKFKTTVKINGDLIDIIERSPIPYRPSKKEQLCTETFDFISILGSFKQPNYSYKSNSGTLQSDTYEVTLEAIPVDTKGTISKATIFFIVK